ncbi:hypothetical protein ABZ349_33435 [Streptomyces niveus]|uniref:hypothetical protein n=1 Tax=Streptomyces niveus TaxID=193462 RepID=UPI0033D80B40
MSAVAVGADNVTSARAAVATAVAVAVVLDANLRYVDGQLGVSVLNPGRVRP